MNNHRTNGRPPLDWQPVGVYTGPDPVVPEKAPDHVKAKARRHAAVQVSIASAGFDHKEGIDRVKFSYRLGWLDNENFQPASNIPDERVTEFIEALQKVAANAKIAHSNALKKAKGQLASSIGEQMKAGGARR